MSSHWDDSTTCLPENHSTTQLGHPAMSDRSRGNSGSWKGGGIMLQQVPDVKKPDIPLKVQSLDEDFVETNLVKDKLNNIRCNFDFI